MGVVAIPVPPEAIPKGLVKLKEVALREVKVAELAVPVPIEGGEAQVEPSRVEALIVPVPVKSKDAPVPTTMAATVLVPEVIPENGT